MPEENCIFCDIVCGRTGTVIEWETKEFVIFKDIRPAALYHYLIVPKQHIESLTTLDKSHTKMVGDMEAVVKGFMESKGINTKDAIFGFHCPPFISVKHLHMHAIGPLSNMGFLSRMLYRPSSPWFKTTEEAQIYLTRK